MEWFVYPRIYISRVRRVAGCLNERRKQVSSFVQKESIIFAFLFQHADEQTTKFPTGERETSRSSVNLYLHPPRQREITRKLYAVYLTFLRSFPFGSAAIASRTSFAKLAQRKLGKRESSLPPFLSLFIYVLFARRRERKFAFEI